MDFRGQRLAETLGMYLVVASAVIAFLVGYWQQDFSAMMKLFGGGVAVAFVVSVPDWPVYNKNPVRWLPPKEQPEQRRGGSGSGSSARQKQKSWSNFFGMF